MDEIPKINSHNGVKLFLEWLKDLEAETKERELNL